MRHRLALAATLLVLPAAAEAYLLAGAKWAPADIPVDWRFNTFDEPDLPADNERTEVRTAFASWQNLPTSDITFNELAPRAVTACGGLGMFQQDGNNIITFADPCNQLDAITLGLTALFGANERLDNSCAQFLRITESDMVFSEEHLLLSHADAGLPGCRSGWDIQVVAAHEIGHLIGLDHTAIPTATMYAVIGQCEPDKANLHADDVDGAACIYPSGTPSCFAQSVAAVSDPALCAGQSVNLIGTGSSVSGCTGVVEYRWTGTSGFLRDWSTVANASDTPLATTDYTLEVRCSSPVCSDSAPAVTVVVTDNPAADAGPAERVCAGSSVTLGATPPASGGTPPYVLRWSAAPPDRTLSCTACANPTAAPAVATTYTLQVTDSAGCVAQASKTVNVDPVPLANAGADETLCAGQPTTLGGAPTASGGTPPYTLLWSATPPDPTLTCPSCDNPSVTPAATTTYRVDVSDGRGCVASASRTVTVDTPASPLPIGNTLLAVRGLTLTPPAPDDLLLQWSGAGGSAVTYRARRSASKDFPPPGDDLGTGAAGAPLRLPGEVRTSGSPLHYRVAGVDCAGGEGPL